METPYALGDLTQSAKRIVVGPLSRVQCFSTWHSTTSSHEQSEWQDASRIMEPAQFPLGE